MQKINIVFGGIAAATAVIFGAFGAHYLKTKLSPESLQVFETGVKYQFYHAFALLFLALIPEKFILNGSSINYSGYAFIIGIILFSGSLYLLSLKSLLGIENWTWLGPVTPFGGLSLITGWLILVFSIIRSKY